jgi:phospholipid/cholesterol/gamma-HCH transport system substrate-binding protein
MVVDDAQGLRKGDGVRMRGVTIGRVGKFKMAVDGVSIALELEHGFEIPADSRFILHTVNILGEMVVEVMPGTSPATLGNEVVVHGERGGSVVGEVQNLSEAANGALGRVQALLSAPTVNNVQEGTAQLVEVLRELSPVLQEVRTLTKNLNDSAASVADATAGPELSRTVQNVEQLTARLDHLATALDRTTASATAVLTRIDRGEGSLGRLSTDDALYKDANQAMIGIHNAAAELTTLLQDIRLHPQRYVKLSLF